METGPLNGFVAPACPETFPLLYHSASLCARKESIKWDIQGSCDSRVRSRALLTFLLLFFGSCITIPALREWSKKRMRKAPCSRLVHRIKNICLEFDDRCASSYSRSLRTALMSGLLLRALDILQNAINRDVMIFRVVAEHKHLPLLLQLLLHHFFSSWVIQQKDQRHGDMFSSRTADRNKQLRHRWSQCVQPP